MIQKKQQGFNSQSLHLHPRKGSHQLQHPPANLELSIKCEQILMQSPIFSQQTLTLADLSRIGNQRQLSERYRMVEQYLNIKEVSKITGKSKLAGGSQFATQIKKIPSQTIIYFTIKQARNNRFNILVRFNSGELIGFFETILQCKILGKIIKLLEKVPPTVLIFISDLSSQPKLAQQINAAPQGLNLFIYSFQGSPQNRQQIFRKILQNTEINRKSQNCYFVIYSDCLFCCASCINKEMLVNLESTLRSRLRMEQHADDEILVSMRGKVSEWRKELAIDFLVVNIARIYHCQIPHIFEFIQHLFKQQEQLFMRKDQTQRKKHEQWESERDLNWHFPQKMKGNRHCKRCENLPKKEIRKSCYRCTGCSAYFRKDIALCPLCFEDFHERMSYFEPKINKNRKNTPKPMSMAKQEGSSEKPIKFQENLNINCQVSSDPFTFRNDEMISANQTKKKLRIASISDALSQAISKFYDGIESRINQWNLNFSECLLLGNLQQTIVAMDTIARKYPQMDPGILQNGVNAMKIYHELSATKHQQPFLNSSSSYPRCSQQNHPQSISSHIQAKEEQMMEQYQREGENRESSVELEEAVDEEELFEQDREFESEDQEEQSNIEGCISSEDQNNRNQSIYEDSASSEKVGQ